MNFIKLTCQRALINESIIRAITVSPSRFIQTSHNLLLSQDGAGKSKGRLQGSFVIRLYDQNGKVIGHKTKQEAEMIAKKNGFSLVAMEIVGKPKFPEYQLKSRFLESSSDNMDDEHNSTQTIPENNNSPSNKDSSKRSNVAQKEIKRIQFETSIAAADLKVKMDQMNQMIAKGKEVHLTIISSNSVPMEIFSPKVISMFSQDTRFLQNKPKGSNLKLIVDKKPNKEETDSTQEEVENEFKPGGKSKSSKKQADQFVIDDSLLENDAELEKFLQQKKWK